MAWADTDSDVEYDFESAAACWPHIGVDDDTPAVDQYNATTRCSLREPRSQAISEQQDHATARASADPMGAPAAVPSDSHIRVLLCYRPAVCDHLNQMHKVNLQNLK